MPTILVVDSDLTVARAAATLLSADGYTLKCVNGALPTTQIHSDVSQLSLMLTELPPVADTHLSLVRTVRSASAATPILVTSVVQSVKRAVHAMQAGVTDFVDRPGSANDFVSLVKRWTAPHSMGSLYVSRVLNIVAEEFGNDTLSLASVASRLHISPEYLCRLIKRETGATFSQHLSRCRAASALSWLATTELSIKEIAARCGYGSTASFDRSFRKSNHCSPTDYRRTARMLATPAS